MILILEFVAREKGKEVVERTVQYGTHLPV